MRIGKSEPSKKKTGKKTYSFFRVFMASAVRCKFFSASDGSATHCAKRAFFL